MTVFVIEADTVNFWMMSHRVTNMNVTKWKVSPSVNLVKNCKMGPVWENAPLADGHLLAGLLGARPEMALF